MIVAIHQPVFLPWLGFFYKMYKSDIFVLLDNVSYIKNAVANRNKIKTPHGSEWITVPVLTKGRSGQLISRTETNNTVDWRAKHIRTLKMNYAKANFFDWIFSELETVYSECLWENLCAFNIRLLAVVCHMLGLKRKMILSSSLRIKATGTQRLIKIVKKLGGAMYLSGFGGANYQDEEMFHQAGIKLRYSDFAHPVYPQLWGSFISKCSTIDLLFNCGPESLKIIASSGDSR